MTNQKPILVEVGDTLLSMDCLDEHKLLEAIASERHLLMVIPWRIVIVDGNVVTEMHDGTKTLTLTFRERTDGA